jgi:hypothetical protein
MKTKLLFTGIAILALTTVINAQDKTSGGQSQQQAITPPARGAYIDANNNGICDYYEAPGRFYRGGRRMANVQTPGYRRGLAPGQGRGFGPGQGRGLGPGQGRGLAPGGRYFVDEDKNGICDIYEKTVKKNELIK